MDAAVTSEPQYVDDERPEVQPGFWRPESLADVEWCLERIGQLEATVAENEAVFEKRVEQLRARTDAINVRPQRGVEFFRSLVREYAENHRAELLKGGKAKSRKLQHGTVGWKKAGGDPVMKDPTAVLAWAKEQPEEMGFVRVKEEPAWSAIKTYVKGTGELPPGVELEPEREEFTIKTEGAK